MAEKITTTLVDQASATVYYVGTAFKNNATSEPVWTIIRITLDSPGAGDVVIDNVIDDGSGNLIKPGFAIWDNRTSLTYG